MTRLRVIDRAEGLPTYGLPLGAMNDLHNWFQFYPGRFFTPAFLAKVPEHLQGVAVRLWSHAMSHGDPAGTLPTDPRELGAIFGRHHNHDACVELRNVVLWDWTEHLCVADDDSQPIIRLAHPVFARIAVEAWQRSQRTKQRQPERTGQQRVRRVLAHLKDMHGGALANLGTAEEITAALTSRGQTLTRRNVQEEAERLSMPSEAELKRPDAN